MKKQETEFYFYIWETGGRSGRGKEVVSVIMQNKAVSAAKMIANTPLVFITDPAPLIACLHFPYFIFIHIKFL